jgi:hypothetical protein
MRDSQDNHCPNCTSDKIVQSHRRGFFELRVLRFTHRRPYRCVACQHRFYRRVEMMEQPEAEHGVQEKQAQLFGN